MFDWLIDILAETPNVAGDILFSKAGVMAMLTGGALYGLYRAAQVVVPAVGAWWLEVRGAVGLGLAGLVGLALLVVVVAVLTDVEVY